MDTLRNKTIRLAHGNPTLRTALLPLLSKEAAAVNISIQKVGSGVQVVFYIGAARNIAVSDVNRMASQVEQARDQALAKGLHGYLTHASWQSRGIQETSIGSTGHQGTAVMAPVMFDRVEPDPVENEEGLPPLDFLESQLRPYGRIQNL